LKGTALTFGAATLLKTALTPAPVQAQPQMGAGIVHRFTKGGVTFHTYVSPPQAVHVTSHVVEFADQLLVVDGTMLPPTAAEVAELIASTGKPVAAAYISHEHPDHWGGASTLGDVAFATLPEIRAPIGAEAAQGQFPTPTNVLEGPDLELGAREISGVLVEFRHYTNTEAPHMIVAAFPDQQVMIVQDLVYNGVFFAPGVDRDNWIATLENLRDDPIAETLLVGHGLPTTRGELDTAIAYLHVLNDAMTAANPEAAAAQLRAAFPGYGGEFLLSLIPEYWG